jgi:ABC-type antimicrobial peptide transport system permease subunit
MNEFPLGVFIILLCGLIFTSGTIYYILRLAYLEMKDEISEFHDIDKQ